jgi:hypothetical protein
VYVKKIEVSFGIKRAEGQARRVGWIGAFNSPGAVLVVLKIGMHHMTFVDKFQRATRSHKPRRLLKRRRLWARRGRVLSHF